MCNLRQESSPVYNLDAICIVRGPAMKREFSWLYLEKIRGIFELFHGLFSNAERPHWATRVPQPPLNAFLRWGPFYLSGGRLSYSYSVEQIPDLTGKVMVVTGCAFRILS